MLIVSSFSGKQKGLQHALVNQEAVSDAGVQGERHMEGARSPPLLSLPQFHTLSFTDLCGVPPNLQCHKQNQNDAL